MSRKVEDSELLDHAARAQGWIDYPQDSIEAGSHWHLDSAKAPFGPRIEKQDWRPLTNDGDAFRLAVAMCMPLEITDEVTEVIPLGIIEEHGPDPLAATRRAIVRAAAEIWRVQQ